MSVNIFAETYSCDYGLGAFTLKRINSETISQFQYQKNNYSPEFYSITKETVGYIYLMDNTATGGASLYIIGKFDNSFVGVFLKHRDSSQVFNGKCYSIK